MNLTALFMQGPLLVAIDFGDIAFAER